MYLIYNVNKKQESILSCYFLKINKHLWIGKMPNRGIDSIKETLDSETIVFKLKNNSIFLKKSIDLFYET